MATCNCRTILTTDVAVTGNNLVLTIPEGTYVNCENYVIRVAQDIPSPANNKFDTMLHRKIPRPCGLWDFLII